MLWRDRRQSENVEDRRGISGGGLAVGGGLGGIVVLVIALLLGADPRDILEQAPANDSGSPATSRPVNPEETELRQFVGAALADTEDVWTDIFRKSGRQYPEPKLVFIYGSGQVRVWSRRRGGRSILLSERSEGIYIDLSFYRELKTRFGAPGDFAQAYVIAHEIGHHVQNLLGTMDKVNSARGGMRKESANQLSVRLELQADFFAGVWAHYAQMRGIVEPGDIDEALRAATAIGDDRLQRQSQGYVVPDSFTHGTSEQRSRWFRKGFETGDIRQGDTFSAGSNL